MTDVLIDRELLEQIRELLCIIGHRQDDYGVEAEYIGSLLKKVLANPTQQDEVVEVVAWLRDGHDRSATASRAVMCDWANSGHRVLELMTVAQHQRILDASVPAGCKVVPVEPTDAMRRAAQDKLAADGFIVTDWLVHAIYTAMLASAEGVKDA